MKTQRATACACTVPESLTLCALSPFKYLMIQQTPFVRRQVRKLLLFICGSKEKYRQLRDLHTLDSHVRGIKKLLEEQGIFLRASVVTASSGSALQYDTLISLVRPVRGSRTGRGCVLGLNKVGNRMEQHPQGLSALREHLARAEVRVSLWYPAGCCAV